LSRLHHPVQDSQYKDGTTKACSILLSVVPYRALQCDRCLVITTWSNYALIFPWLLSLGWESTRFGTFGGPTRWLLSWLFRWSYGKDGNPCAAKPVVVADLANREFPTRVKIGINW